MKSFDLEKAKAGKPLVMRNGEVVTFVAHVPTGRQENSRLIVLDERGILRFYHDNGNYLNDGVSMGDVLMAPEKRIVWMNLYPNNPTGYDSHAHDTEEDANKSAGPMCDARVGKRAWPLEIED